MRSYELVLIVRGSLAEALRKKAFAAVKALLKELKIVTEKEIGQKTLAYKINRETSGFYYELALEGENVPVDFEKRLLENENVLRHILLRTK